MNRSILNRLLLGASLASTTALAACEEPTLPQPAEPPAVEEVAPVVEETSLPDRVEAPETAETPAPVETLPSDQRSSEQTVQPESDTLFY